MGMGLILYIYYCRVGSKANNRVAMNFFVYMHVYILYMYCPTSVHNTPGMQFNNISPGGTGCVC